MATIRLLTNTASLGAQRRLGESTAKLARSFERVSSGRRVNRAGDDAAGLAIAAGLNVDRLVYAQGVRNINDAVSYLNVAEGAVGEMKNVLIRLRELSVQSANGTLGHSQRQALDEEAQALVAEYNRIIAVTDFNDIAVFDESNRELSIQAGYGSGGQLTATLGFTSTFTAGNGTFQAPTLYAVGSRPRSVTAGDFNGDGVPDLVTADSSSDTVSVLLGNGDGSFQAGTAYGTGIGPRSVTVGDFNGDGVLDLVTADTNNDGVSVLLGNGDGSFQARTPYAVGLTPLSVAAGDFNGDGVLDLATAEYNSDTASVLLGNGDGTFQPRTSYVTGVRPYSVAAGDFNGDGVLDLVTTDEGSGTTSVLLGNNDGTFQPRTSHAAGSEPHSVAVGDFNGDGVLDLVAANYSANAASVLIGNATSTTTILGARPLSGVDVASLLAARESQALIDGYFEEVNAVLGAVGASMSRFEAAIGLLGVQAENLATAESRIVDADIAEEAATLVKNRISQQAGAAVLTQANQLPALALNLLDIE